jgi:hypothetical protein
MSESSNLEMHVLDFDDLIQKSKSTGLRSTSDIQNIHRSLSSQKQELLPQPIVTLYEDFQTTFTKNWKLKLTLTVNNDSSLVGLQTI